MSTEDAPLDRVVAALDAHGCNHRRRSGQVIACCPAHDDSSPSLSVAVGTSQPVVLRCHAGCDQGTILDALGLTWDDVSAPRQERPRERGQWTPAGTATDVYDYSDETGRLLFQVLRVPKPDGGKTFLQRVPDASAPSGWRWQLGKTRRVLYRLPDLPAAIAAGCEIAVTEGEKDVQALARIGVVATCNPGGAGKWRPEYAPPLRGARVVVIADNDRPGLDHARDVADSLQGVAAQVRVVRPAVDSPKADVSDHLAAGFGLADLVPILATPGTPTASGTPTGTPTQVSDLGRGQQGQQGQGQPDRQVSTLPRRTRWTAKELMAVTFEPPKWAVPGILAEGVNLLCGPPKVGKSWMALNLAVAVATGGKAFGQIDVDAGDVLYLALEDTGRRLQSRLRKVLAGVDIAPDRLVLETVCKPFPEGAAHIRRWLDDHPDARMVVIDVFAKMRGSATPNSSAYDADYTAVGHAKHIADEYGITVVLVHHVRKQGSDDFLAEVSGTNGIAGAADAVLVLKRSRGEADGVLHITGRDVDEAELALNFVADRGAWDLLPGPAHS